MRSRNRGYRSKSRIMKTDTTSKQEVSLASRNKNDRNPEKHLLRLQDQKSTVSDLVYKYLRKAAYLDSVQKQRNNSCSKFRKRNARNRIIHPSQRYSKGEGSEARSYLREALSFAVETGYLIPTDRAGKLLRLSSKITLHQSCREKYI